MDETTQPSGTGSEPVQGGTTADQNPNVVETTQTGVQQEPNLPGQPAPNPIAPHTAAAAHGVVARLESDLEKELAHGVTHFKTWLKTGLAELKLHLKV